MVLEDGQKRAAYSGYLGFDQWGYLVVTTMRSASTQIDSALRPRRSFVFVASPPRC